MHNSMFLVKHMIKQIWGGGGEGVVIKGQTCQGFGGSGFGWLDKG